MRLFTRDASNDTLAGLKSLMATLLKLAKDNREVVLPGYTHLQPAQPVLLAHHLLAYFEMFTRDHARFSDCGARADVMPLGSGALAGAAYKLDREAVARELGFREVSRNSLDAVADRDFILEFEAAASITMMHLSRLAEEIIIWSTEEFGFVELHETFATGSSIMPQKKNPDVAELARGKTGRVYGHLMAMLTTMKALPLAYNRDLQEDKEGLFDTVDTLLATLEVFRGMLATLTVRPERMMAAAAGRGYLLATDLADYLVGKGEPFRSAHGIVARLVSHLISTGRTPEQLELSEYHEFCPRFEADVYEISVTSSLNARDIPGGTAPGQVAQALRAAEKAMEELPD
jgi:argininosuccinate lyase